MLHRLFIFHIPLKLARTCSCHLVFTLNDCFTLLNRNFIVKKISSFLYEGTAPMFAARSLLEKDSPSSMPSGRHWRTFQPDEELFFGNDVELNVERLRTQKDFDLASDTSAVVLGETFSILHFLELVLSHRFSSYAPFVNPF